MRRIPRERVSLLVRRDERHVRGAVSPNRGGEIWGAQRPISREPLRAGGGVASVDLVGHVRTAKTHTEDLPRQRDDPTASNRSLLIQLSFVEKESSSQVEIESCGVELEKCSGLRRGRCLDGQRSLCARNFFAGARGSLQDVVRTEPQPLASL